MRQTCKLSLTSSESATIWTLLYFCQAALSRAASSMLTSKARRARRWNNGKSGSDHHDELRLCRQGFRWMVSLRHLDLQGTFDLRQEARLIAKDPHFPQPPKNSNKTFRCKIDCPKARSAPPEQRDQLAQWLLSDHRLFAKCTETRVLHGRNTTT